MHLNTNALSKNIKFYVSPGGYIYGTINVPGDKSISHRAIMFGAIAEGTTKINGFLEGEDCLATLAAFRDMGVKIIQPAKGQVHIQGVGLHGLKAPNKPLNLGNAGTSMRLLTGLLAGQKFATTLIGDESLSRRPMGRVTLPISNMGGDVTTSQQGTAPIHIKPVTKLQGINYLLPVASAQIKSCVLLAGLYADGTTCVQEPKLSRDHTERMLSRFGYDINIKRENMEVCITGAGKLQASDIDIPGDISSAAFFLVGASIASGSDLTLLQIGINPTRTGVIEILQAMGADITIMNARLIGGEPVADLRVKSAKLHGVHIQDSVIPSAIDEFPVLFIAAACAEGETILSGAAELRVKESDRIQAMADGLTVLGIAAEPRPDGIVIQGGKIGGGNINSLGDHRIAMAFAIAGLVAQQPIIIDNCANVNTSFPGFMSLAAQVGLDIRDEA